MKEKQLRYELDKMQGSYHKDLGISFVKNSNPSGTAHWHDCYEIEFIVSGTVDDIINDCVYKVKPGDLFLLTPNDFHELRNFKDFVGYIVMFPESVIDEKLLSRLEARDLSTNIFARLSENERRKVEALFLIMEQELKNKEIGYDTIFKNCLNTVISFIIREGFTKSTVKSRYTSVRQGVNYIKNNFQRPITLTEVANEVNLDSKYFSVLFKRSIGVSFKDFLNETRLNCALKYLKSSNMPVTEICYSCGYGSISSFNRAFKKEYGISPREYRNMNNGDKNV